MATKREIKSAGTTELGGLPATKVTTWPPTATTSRWPSMLIGCEAYEHERDAAEAFFPGHHAAGCARAVAGHDCTCDRCW